MFYALTEDQIRNLCKEKIESLEYWLRRLIDEKLSASHGDYFSCVDGAGNRLIKKGIVDALEERLKKEPTRYSRKIDAVLLSDAIDIICNPQLYSIFAPGLRFAFPEGRDEARTFMRRLLDPRNSLAHSNPISLHQAEQVVCYSSDIIESLKQHYGAIGMQNEYNVPTILKFSDSFGNVYFRNRMIGSAGGVLVNLSDQPTNVLYPGDMLTLEVEVDPAFDPIDYTIRWKCSAGSVEPIPNGPKAIINITTKHVDEQMIIWCNITSNNEWHRMGMGGDDRLSVFYKVRPPR
jgi:hypothetical protein